MATTSIRTTYSLDVDTVRKLDRLAKHWGVPKSEAMRRAIRIAAESDLSAEMTPLEAFERLRQEIKLTPEAAEQWMRTVREEREAWPDRLDQ